MTSEWPTTMCVANWRIVFIFILHKTASSQFTIRGCSSRWIEREENRANEWNEMNDLFCRQGLDEIVCGNNKSIVMFVNALRKKLSPLVSSPILYRFLCSTHIVGSWKQWRIELHRFISQSGFIQWAGKSYKVVCDPNTRAIYTWINGFCRLLDRIHWIIISIVW